MLIEYDIEGNKIDKVAIAIERLKCMELIALEYHQNGFYVADSGGKDSMVITFISFLAKVKFEIVHNHTTVDHPKTVYHIRQLKKWWNGKGIDFTISFPIYQGERTSIWKLIPTKGLPTRLQRWCCSVLKEQGGIGRVVVTGVRWEESNKRKSRGVFETISPKIKDKISLNNDNDFKRKSIEHCMQKGKIVVNPIIEWTIEEVWEFIKQYNLPYNPLYNEGYNRVGCVGCPMSRNDIELEKNPKYKQMYINAGSKTLDYRNSKGKENTGNWETPEKYYLWWTEQIKKEIAQVDGQMEWGD